MSDEEDLKRQIRQTYDVGNSLIHRIYMCSENVKTLLVKPYMSSSNLSQVWCELYSLICRSVNSEFN